MTVAEFKAWLEGFEAAMSGAPTPEQWEAIKAKVVALRSEGQPEVTYRFPGKPSSPWWEPNVSYNDDRTVPLRAH